MKLGRGLGILTYAFVVSQLLYITKTPAGLVQIRMMLGLKVLLTPDVGF